MAARILIGACVGVFALLAGRAGAEEPRRIEKAVEVYRSEHVWFRGELGKIRAMALDIVHQDAKSQRAARDYILHFFATKYREHNDFEDHVLFARAERVAVLHNSPHASAGFSRLRVMHSALDKSIDELVKTGNATPFDARLFSHQAETLAGQLYYHLDEEERVLMPYVHLLVASGEQAHTFSPK